MSLQPNGPLVGRSPAFNWVPPARSSYGHIAAEVAVELGRPMDADQRMILDAIFAEDEPGVPTSFEVAVIAPRQNLKTATLEIAALTDVFVFGEPLHIWTAHLFKTSTAAFHDMVGLIESNDDFRRRCRPPRVANGSEMIELLTGERIEFHARSKGGGRGRTGAKITLDEALFLSPVEIGALVPTLATMRGAQIRYGSSAGLATSDVLRRLRDRGRAGGDGRLAYIEYAAPEDVHCDQLSCLHEVGTPGCMLDREDLLRLANPALGRRIAMETIQAFRKLMPPAEFIREFFGRWDDPETALSAISLVDWRALVDAKSSPVDPVVFGVDVAPDRSVASIGVAGWRTDIRQHVELMKRDAGTGWVVDWLVTRFNKWKPTTVVLDPSSPAGSLITELEDNDIPVLQATSRDIAQACGVLFDDIKQGELRHLGQPELESAVAGANKKSRGDAFIWARNPLGIDITPLYAVTLAKLGLDRFKPPGSVYEDREVLTV